MVLCTSGFLSDNTLCLIQVHSRVRTTFAVDGPNSVKVVRVRKIILNGELMLYAGHYREKHTSAWTHAENPSVRLTKDKESKTILHTKTASIFVNHWNTSTPHAFTTHKRPERTQDRGPTEETISWQAS
jgi:hypothetical protein